MQEVSALYNSIISANPHWFECSLAIGESGRLMNERGFIITFADSSILIARGGGDDGYQENILKSIAIGNRVFSENTPSVGNAIAGEITVEMLMPISEIPRMAQLVPYVRVCNATSKSEWIQKGVFFTDTREIIDNANGSKILVLHGYDAMLKADVDYDYSRIRFPATDINVVRDIASALEISIDSRTITKMNKHYSLQLPAGYTMREILGYIAAMYCGNFIINDVGELRLVSLNELPEETRCLVVGTDDALIFGGDRILV